MNDKWIVKDWELDKVQEWNDWFETLIPTKSGNKRCYMGIIFSYNVANGTEFNGDGIPVKVGDRLRKKYVQGEMEVYHVSIKEGNTRFRCKPVNNNLNYLHENGIACCYNSKAMFLNDFRIINK